MRRKFNCILPVEGKVGLDLEEECVVGIEKVLPDGSDGIFGVGVPVKLV